MSWTERGRHRGVLPAGRPGILPASRSSRLAVAGAMVTAVVLLGLAGYHGASAGTVAGSATCTDPTVAPTVEEARLDQPVPGQSTPVGTEIVRRGGFAAMVDDFATALCGVPDAAAASATVDRYGRSLWEAAVARAQRPDPTGADALPANDDRPLYWARLAMARDLRQWKPGFAATDADRAGWQHRLEYASRGMTTEDFTPAQGQRKLFISGFDPFQLDDDVRRSNPSGTVALRLDGRVLTVNGTSVQVQAVVLPVRFQDFDDGIVEDAFRPHLAAGPQGADMFTTTSQGNPGRFDLEVYNGRRRSSVVGDNLDVQGGGQITNPMVPPGMGPGPEFLQSTLPLQQMQAAGSGGAFPVQIHREVVEIPAGSSTPQRNADGPTPGSVAVEGGGGGYLSNESAYRVTRLVAEGGRAMPAGHLHTPVLDFDPANSTEITDPTLVANRTAIAAEAERILLAGAAVPA